MSFDPGARLRFPCVGPALLVAACAHVDLPRPPGDVDLTTPPDAANGAVLEPARDEGERSFTISPGLFAQGGVRLDDHAHGAADLGGELSLRYGWSRFSHHDPAPLLLEYRPEQALGLNIGWTAALTRDLQGPFYLELEYQRDPLPYGLAAGWAWLPAAHAHGLQTTAFWGPFFLRGSYVAHQTSITLGLMIKLPYAWVWGR